MGVRGSFWTKGGGPVGWLPAAGSVLSEAGSPGEVAGGNRYPEPRTAGCGGLTPFPRRRWPGGLCPVVFAEPLFPGSSPPQLARRQRG